MQPLCLLAQLVAARCFCNRLESTDVTFHGFLEYYFSILSSVSKFFHSFSDQNTASFPVVLFRRYQVVDHSTVRHVSTTDERINATTQLFVIPRRCTYEELLYPWRPYFEIFREIEFLLFRASLVEHGFGDVRRKIWEFLLWTKLCSI